MKTSEIFKLRNNFSIIGLTGKTGSGCTLFANIISKPIKFDNTTMLRRPEDIELLEKYSDNNIIFKRKYSICYNYFQKYTTEYETISYTHVLLFYTLHYLIHYTKITTTEDIINNLHKLLNINYKKLIASDRDSDYHDVIISRAEIASLSDDYVTIIENLKKVRSNIDEIRDLSDLSYLYNSFFGESFKNFAKEFYLFLGKKDYYLGSLFVHRLGNKIRATGDPLLKDEDLKKVKNTTHIYTMATLINKLIKAWKSKSKECHICIDSLRNSLEIMFFKERYSAFYMVAIHNDDRHKYRIKDRISNLITKDKQVSYNDVNLIAQKVIDLDKIEYGIEDFKDGHFFAPDVENCIQKSEIHINNPGEKIDNINNVRRDTSFYTMIEQWVKIKSLISHPGLITPSHEERCMQIAYNSKFNSGCISRQVGAIITDENNAIRSIGWNDVPKGSVPCNLRNLNDVINVKKIDILDRSYSSFEMEQKEEMYIDGNNFSKNVREQFEKKIPETESYGLNHSFCFKSLHNKFENKDNQVHTRSLHAEENAMMQVSKFGGQPLKNGTLYTTASPCELCAKKAYQLGVKKIVYIDPYPGISIKHILANGYNVPECKLFTGIIGKSYNKLFEPLLSYKDELSIIHK